MSTASSRSASIVAAALLGVVAVASPASAQCSPSAARRDFALIVDAAEALVAVELLPGDANGQLRAWDRRFSDRLHRINRGELRCSSVSHACAIREADTLIRGAYRVIGARDGLFSSWAPDARGALASALANLRLVADDAAHRRDVGLSCEDLPSDLEIGDDDHGLGNEPAALFRVARGGTEALDAAHAAARGSSEPEPDQSSADVLGVVWTVSRVQTGMADVTVRLGDGDETVAMGEFAWTCRVTAAESVEREVRRTLSCAHDTHLAGTRLACSIGGATQHVDLALAFGGAARVVRLSCEPTASPTTGDRDIGL